MSRSRLWQAPGGTPGGQVRDGMAAGHGRAAGDSATTGDGDDEEDSERATAGGQREARGLSEYEAQPKRDCAKDGNKVLGRGGDKCMNLFMGTKPEVHKTYPHPPKQAAKEKHPPWATQQFLWSGTNRTCSIKQESFPRKRRQAATRVHKIKQRKDKRKGTEPRAKSPRRKSNSCPE